MNFTCHVPIPCSHTCPSPTEPIFPQVNPHFHVFFLCVTPLGLVAVTCTSAGRRLFAGSWTTGLSVTTPLRKWYFFPQQRFTANRPSGMSGTSEAPSPPPWNVGSIFFRSPADNHSCGEFMSASNTSRGCLCAAHLPWSDSWVLSSSQMFLQPLRVWYKK